MTTQSLEMSDSIQSSTRAPGILRRLILLLAFTAGIVFWVSVLYRYQTRISQMLMMIFADIAIALAAGLGARLTLYDRHWLLRFLAALLALALGLYGLGFLTHWGIGIGPIESWQKRIESLDIIQFVAGLAIALLGLTAWRRPSTHIEDAEIEPEPAHASSSPRRRTRSHAPQLPRFHLPTSWSSSSSARSSSSRNGRLKVKKARANGRAAAAQERVVVARPIKPARSRRKKAAARKPELQLSVYEEHRCPYCLEEVKRNDPRGIKECEICHTLHHADCWNVTGMCQIPHLNSLNL